MGIVALFADLQFAVAATRVRGAATNRGLAAER
jgi:hypothetical protein